MSINSNNPTTPANTPAKDIKENADVKKPEVSSFASFDKKATDAKAASAATESKAIPMPAPAKK